MIASRIPRVVVFLLIAVLFTGCEVGFITIGAGEHGVVFSKLPRIIGGGLKDKILLPGEKEFIFPWEEVVRVDTRIKVLTWGGIGVGSEPERADYVETRTKDGNEVGLSITVQYRVSSDPEDVRHVVQEVGASKEKIVEIVSSMARADIRTHMNTLSTFDYFDPAKRQAAVRRVRDALRARLKPEGIEVVQVDYQRHLFERARDKGEEPDRRFQDQIDLAQELEEERRLAINRRETKIGQLRAKYETVEGENRSLVARAEGLKRRAIIRGDAFLEQKSNQADLREAQGLKGVQALRKQVEALNAPGAEKILKLELAKALAEANSKFILLGGKKGDGQLRVEKTDTNQLLKQLGLISAMAEDRKQADADPDAPEQEPGQPEAK